MNRLILIGRVYTNKGGGGFILIYYSIKVSYVGSQVNVVENKGCPIIPAYWTRENYFIGKKMRMRPFQLN